MLLAQKDAESYVDSLAMFDSRFYSQVSCYFWVLQFVASLSLKRSLRRDFQRELRRENSGETSKETTETAVILSQTGPVQWPMNRAGREQSGNRTNKFNKIKPERESVYLKEKFIKIKFTKKSLQTKNRVLGESRLQR